MVNGNSFPSMHEIIAISQLKSKGVFNYDAVFIPGHSGDLLGGSQYVKSFKPDLLSANIARQLIKSKFDISFFTKSGLKQKESELSNRIKNDYVKGMIPSTIFEDIDLSEKISKHILNAANIYIYYGYKSYFPYWDTELLDFFKKVPVQYKLGKKLYDAILKENWFSPMGIAYEEELHPTVLKLKIQNTKNIIKRYFPNYIKKYYNEKNDIILYHPFTDKWQLEMQENGFMKKKRAHSYNSIIAQQVIYKLKSKL